MEEIKGLYSISVLELENQYFAIALKNSLERLSIKERFIQLVMTDMFT